MKVIKIELSKDNPERLAVFEKNAQTFAKKIIANFSDFEFVCNLFILLIAVPHLPQYQYTGESMNPDGMIALLNYRVRLNCNLTLQ
jgi:Translationally controlled tumour protein